uniref:TTF-type domain-containing protein n=2 Tax=Amphimedon queenslandica TaxID=400682 RepID=A0A1X7TIY2_AMPQE
MSTGNHQAGTSSQFPQIDSSLVECGHDETSLQIGVEQFEPDIGKLIELHGCANIKQLSRDEIYCVLKSEPDVHPESYPRTCSHQSTRSLFRQFQPSWVKKHPWLHYSRHVDGAYCRACVFFAPDQVSGHTLGHFVTTPFTAWIKMSEKANLHAKNDYHQSAITRMTEFIARYEDPSVSIGTLLNSESSRIIEGNTKVIESLMKVVIVCGKQGLALRGHRDDNVDWTDEGYGRNEGNFIELVRF